MRKMLIGFAAPVAAIVVVAAAMLVPGPSGSEESSAERVPVRQSSWVCPTFDGVTVRAGQLSPAEKAEAVALPQNQPVDGLDDPGLWRSVPGAGEAVALTQTGADSGAVGFLAGVAGADGDGLVVSGCPERSDDAWFTGLGARDGHDSQVVLVNPGQQQAVVRLSAWTEVGEVAVAGDESVTLEPGEVRRIAASELAAEEPMLTLRVERLRGVATAQVLDTGSGPVRGSEMLTAAPGPAKDQVVAAAAGGGERALLLTNPGEDTAHVEVSALGADNGTYVLEGLNNVSVEPGAVTAVSLPEVAEPLRLQSDTSVTATTRAQTDEDAAAGTVLNDLDGQPALAPVVGDTQLTVASPGEKATATVEAFDAEMSSVGQQQLDVPAGGSASVSAADLGGDAAYLVVSSDTSGLYAQAQYTDGAKVALLGLTAAPATARAPQLTWGG